MSKLDSLDTKTDKELCNDLSNPAYYFNRDINWLDFNSKILELALDKHNPLLEQLKFLAIYYNNLDEFFMVRVANVFLQFINNVESVGADKTNPAKQLSLIRKATLLQLNKAYTHLSQYLVKELQAKNVCIKKYASLSNSQKKYVNDYYNEEIYPVLTPQAIDPTHPLPIISNLSLNFIIQLSSDKGCEHYARLKCPNNLPRYIIVPRERKNQDSDDLIQSTRNFDIILLEEIIRANINSLFTGYTVEKVGLFRITRNTDIKIEEDEAHDLLKTVQHMVDQRRFGNVVRLEINNSMPPELMHFLIDKLNIRSFQVYKIKGILAFSELIGLSGIDKPHLKFPPFKAKIHKFFKEENIGNMYEALNEKDVFLHMPFDNFSSIQEFIRKSCHDPHVIAIKQTLYRTGKDSPIVKALMDARRLGKQVTAVVELKARFDEEQNITWAEELEKAGVHVVYGIPNMKIHAKLCLVVRKENDKVNRYVHIGTGNYNPVTAKIYTDMGLITSDSDICSDVSDLFNVMTGYAKKEEYRKLLVSPFTVRSGLIKAIENEIASHKKHGNGEIHIKCNQLVDEQFIRKLYEASQAGVKIHLQVRGVCCLRPKIKNVSDNIEVTSIVGRFLEHSRVYCFHNNGARKIYVGSADLMLRNLDRRIEVLTPISDPAHIRHIYEDILLAYFREDSNAFYLHNDGTYSKKKATKNELVNIQDYLLNHQQKSKHKD